MTYAQDTRVTAVYGERYSVMTPEGELYARLKQSAFQSADTAALPTVGDYTLLIGNPSGDALIASVLPRKSLLARKMAGKTVQEQAIAANFDDVWIITSLNEEFSPRRIERYASLAWQSGGTPVVILTKLDLHPHAERALHEAREAAPGAAVFAVSAHTGEGLCALAPRISDGRTLLLLGSSGVGKSSLINALAGSECMRVGEIREDDARGRHTTTRRQLITLPTGSHVIDTPGMREVGLWDAEEGLGEAFADIEALARGCRFSDCAHGPEPYCAVKRAVEEGALDAARLKNYLKLQKEAAQKRKP